MSPHARKTMKFGLRALLTCTVLSLPIATTTEAQAQDNSGLSAEELFEAARKAYDDGNLEEAARLYEAAFKKKPSFDVAGNLAQTYYKLGRMADAARMFRYTLDMFPPSESDELRTKVEGMFAEAKSKAATLDISCNTPGATVVVGEREVGQTPVGTAFADPGSVTVTVTKEGYETVTITVTAGEGKIIPVEIELKPVSEGGGPIEPPPPNGEPKDPKDEGLPLWPAFVLGGAAVVGIGVGITGLVVSGGAGSEAEDLINGPDCDSACLAEVDDNLSTEATFQGVGIAGLVAGGALAAGAVVYGIIAANSGSDESAKQNVWITPTADGRGLVVGGAF